MNVVRLGVGLEVPGLTPEEAAQERPGVFVVSPALNRIVTLAQRVEFQRHPQDVLIDYSRLSPPHSETLPLEPEKMIEEEITASAIRRDAFLGELSLMYGEEIGYPTPAEAA
jgi:hypothetical protein